MLRHYPNIHLEGLMKTTKNISQDSRCPGRDLNPGHTKYNAGVLTTRSRLSVRSVFKISQTSLGKSSPSYIPQLGLEAWYGLQPSFLRSSWQSSFNAGITKHMFWNPGSVHSFACCNQFCIYLLTNSVIGMTLSKTCLSYAVLLIKFISAVVSLCSSCFLIVHSSLPLS
jgi:hypothetical protein